VEDGAQGQKTRDKSRKIKYQEMKQRSKGEEEKPTTVRYEYCA
jgi:hypothetical protein